MRVRFAVFVLSMLAAAPSGAQEPPFDADKLVSQAIAYAKREALRSPAVDWPALETRVRSAAAGARDQVDLLAALEILVEGLNDGHSLVSPPSEMRAAFRSRYGREFNAGRYYRKATSTLMRRREPESRLLPAGTGQATLVVVPSYAGDAVHGKSYADKLYASAALGAESSCGYVVDLRGNGGGNMWPMFAGIGDLLGRAPVISNITRDGNHAMYTSLGNAERLFGQPLLDWRPLPRLATLPVAVLIDDGVGSSGEAVAIAFHGRARTKFFGQRTYGLTTMNGQFQLADLKLHVTTGKMADRNGMDFPEGLEPDVQVPSVATSGTDEDPAIAAARAWLAQQPECGSVT